MGLFSSIVGAAVKVVSTPAAVIHDVVSTAVTGETPTATQDLIESATDDIEDILGF